MKKATGTAASVNRKRNPLLDQLAFLDVVEHEKRVLTNSEIQIADTETAKMQFNKEKDDDAELPEEVTDEVFDEMSPKFPKITKNEALANVTLKTGVRVSSQKRKKANFGDEISSAINKTCSEREAIISQLTSTPPED
ncbi:uncharacterized protein [Leptinotarsa decemlineata]|uniref:uncharacterized protein n=1 Tax=Leptinotarsa decemlineata TaxID=7539 RepID=UPI003D30876E